MSFNFENFCAKGKFSEDTIAKLKEQGLDDEGALRLLNVDSIQILNLPKLGERLRLESLLDEVFHPETLVKKEIAETVTKADPLLKEPEGAGARAVQQE